MTNILAHNLLRDVVRQNSEVVLTRNFETRADDQFIRRSNDTNQDGVEDSASVYEYMDGFGLIQIYRIGSNMLIDEVVSFQ